MPKSNNSDLCLFGDEDPKENELKNLKNYLVNI